MRALHVAGHEIADHSLSHRDLRGLGARGLRREVVGAQRLIRRYVGREARSFCYPMGVHDAAARRMVAASGHMIAFTSTEGDLHSAARAMRSPRIWVSGPTRLGSSSLGSIRREVVLERPDAVCGRPERPRSGNRECSR